MLAFRVKAERKLVLEEMDAPPPPEAGEVQVLAVDEGFLSGAAVQYNWPQSSGLEE